MTIEDFNNLSQETKTALMLHWWNYYLKNIFTTEYDLNIFKELLHKDIDKAVEFVMACYAFHNGPTTILEIFRTTKIEDILNFISSITSKSSDEIALYNDFKYSFINEIISTSGLDLSGSRK